MREKFTASQLWYRALYSIRCRLGFNTKLTRLEWAEELIKDAAAEDERIAQDAAETVESVRREHPEIVQYVEAHIDWTVSRLVKGLRTLGLKPRTAGIRDLRRAIIASKAKKGSVANKGT
ncbi:MAG: hypothetical protein WCF42_13640 [Terriglobales bacterium]|jgi:hypothetical protein